MTITNEDCMAMMARYPDGYFDLAIVDPPYGIGVSSEKIGGGRVSTLYKKSKWDNQKPKDSFFLELFRVSQKQMIWGGNYFNLPPCLTFVIWDKKQPDGCDFAMAEFCWLSFKAQTKIFSLYSSHVTQGKRIHPTQKPVALYKWLLDKYAAPIQAKLDRPMRILDTHLGSGSIAIACHDYGYDLTACELDPDYYAAAMKRIRNHMAQQRLF